MPPELANLLNYMNASYARFSPFEDKYFSRLKELLVFHNIVPASATVDRSNFTGLVKNFQSTVMVDPNPDGIPGENTLWALQKDWAPTRGLTLIRSGIPNEAFGGSQIPFQFRSDVEPYYMNLYNEVHANGGIVTSAGSLRPITVVAGTGQSPTSMHYIGIAFDMNTESGMQRIATDAYAIERTGTSHWHVWNKVSSPGTPSTALNAVIYDTATHTINTTAINATVIDFTAIANKNGFNDIGNEGCFPANYICAEWWHFQCEAVLVPYISQFGAELLTIYTDAQLTANAPIWNAKNKIFKRDWN